MRPVLEVVPWLTIRNVVCIVVLLVATCYDLRFRRIPNSLTYGLTAAGLGLAVPLGTVRASVLGLLVGFAAMIAFWFKGAVGGGDVKLVAGVGALVGLPLVVHVLVSTILIGGAMAALVLIWSRPGPTPEVRARSSAAGLRPLPFAVPVALGTGISMYAELRGLASPGALLNELIQRWH